VPGDLEQPGQIPQLVAEGPVAEVLAGYREYLLVERGLALSTIVRYESVVRLFLEQRPSGLELDRLTAADVSGFLARECPRLSVAGARGLVSRLRPLLRYLHVAGLISSPLVWAVPGVADQRDRSLPRGLEPAVVRKLLAGCDRRRTVGRRDYAILRLLVRLGLRAGEVTAIQLEDVHWQRPLCSSVRRCRPIYERTQVRNNPISRRCVRGCWVREGDDDRSDRA
jgi:integrase/recombinase XerD